MNDEEMALVAQKAAKAALAELFLTLGVDISQPEGVLALQADMRHARYMRELSTQLGSKTVSYSFKLILGGLVLWLCLKMGWHIPASLNLGG